MPEVSKKLKIGNDYVYPITKAENIIQLQKTIKEVSLLPSISDVTPNVFRIGQAWFDTTIEDEGFTISEEELLTFASFFTNEQLSFEGDDAEENLSFGENNSNEELSFGKEE